MAAQYFIQILFALTGLVSLLASILNWEWFFTAQNAQFIVRKLGRNRARLFYGIVGIILMIMSVFFFFQVKEAGIQ